MLSVIGDILPIAVAIALNPLVIIVMVLMLLSPNGSAASTAYLAGWVAGIVIAMSVVMLLASFVSGDGLPTFAVIEILLGVGLIFLGWKQLKGRPAAGEAARLPAWMSAVDSMTPSGAFRLGLMLAAVNPKNIVLVASAAVMAAAADIQPAGIVIVILVFALVSSLTIGGPFIAYLVAPERISVTLRDVREWLVQNNPVIMAVLLTVMGIVVIGKGIGLL